MANCLYNATMSLNNHHPRFISATLVCCMMIVIWRKYLFEHLHKNITYQVSDVPLGV